ncbi:MAG: IS110 family transposase [Planctomycetota bacterium]
MYFVGIDLHKKLIVLCVMDQNRRVMQTQKFACCEVGLIRKFFESLGKFRAVVEATASYEWLVDLLEPLADKIVLAHPSKLRVIAESSRKSDKLDAKILAEFLVLDMIPEAYRPTKREREHRMLVRHRVSIRRGINRVKCRIRRVLSDHNTDRDNLFNAKGLQFVRTLILPESERFVLDQLLANYDHLKEQLGAIDRRIKRFAESAPTKEKEARELLATVPGVGEVVTEVILAELGDVNRFGSQKKACAYAGLVPSKRESAGKSKDLGITKEGSVLLRTMLVQSAWVAVRYSRKWGRVYDDLRRRCGPKRAIIAVARRLLTVIVAVLKSGSPYSAAPKVDPKPKSRRKVPEAAHAGTAF